MCLRPRNSNPSISKEEFEVYKCVFKGTNGYVTPFCSVAIPSLPFKMDVSLTTETPSRDPLVIGEGYIHAFPFLEDAKAFVSQYILLNGEPNHRELIILKAHVPANTEYYIGADEWNGLYAIASKTIVLDEEFICDEVTNDNSRTAGESGS
ncbi:MAG: hypothetical protein LUD72_06400 [Bacteroidales bacterium]|nr:hypothetical protein [Bacteroidales bacterium]